MRKGILLWFGTGAIFSVVLLFAQVAYAFPYLPGETLNPSCSPGQSGCIVQNATSSIQFEATTFRATSTTGTSTFPNLDVDFLDVNNLNVTGNVTGILLSGNAASTTNSTSSNATSTNVYVSGFLNALLAYFDTLTARIATLYTATVGSLTATSTANLYGGTQTSNLTATGTTNLSTTYASTIYASTTNASTSNALNFFGTNATFTSATTTNFYASGTILGGRLSVTNATATNLYISGSLTTANPASFSATSSFSTTTAASSTILNGNVTNLYSTNATFTSATATNMYVSGTILGGNISASNATTVNSYTSGTISGGNLNVANATTTSLNVTNGIRAASSTITGTTTTGGLFTSFLSAITSYIQNLIASTATIGSATIGTLTATGTTNLATTYISTLYASTTNASTSNAVNFSGINATFTNATTTNFYASGTILGGNISANNATTTSLNVTNGVTAASTTVSGTGTFGSISVGGVLSASSTGLTVNTTNTGNLFAGAATATSLYVSGPSNLNALRVTGSGTTTFNGPITSQSGNFIIAGPTGVESLLLNPYGGSVGIGGTPLGRFGIQQGTITSAENALNVTGTWNSAPTTFTGLFANFTDTASAAGSYLANFQINGSPIFRISKTGTTTIAGGLVAGATSTFTGISMNSTRISDLLTPSAGNDAATKSYVDALIQGLSWNTPVNSIATSSQATVYAELGLTLAAGQRFILQAGSSGFGSCVAPNIAEYNGTTWDCTPITAGTATGTTVFVDSFINQSYTFNGTSWASLGSAIDHSSLAGLQGGSAGEYYHLTNTQHSNLTGVGAQLAQLKDTGSPTFVGLTTSGTIKAADGSAASSSYTFANDTDTGMYRAGANTIGFATNGISRMTIDANGNVIMNNSSSSAATSSTMNISNTLTVANGAVTASSTGLTANTINTTNLNVTNGISMASTTISGTTTTGGLFASFAHILSLLANALTAYTGTFGTLTATSSAVLASTTLSGNTLLTNATTTNFAVTGQFSAGNFSWSTTTGWLNAYGGTVVGSTSPTVTALFATSTSLSSYFTGGVNTSGITGGYKIDGNTVLQSSSTLTSLFVGQSSFGASMTGTSNVSVGPVTMGALSGAVSGSNNVALGNQVMRFLSSGGSNTGVGTGALASVSTGSFNSALGANALNGNTFGGFNVAVGSSALSVNTTGGNNVAVGATALNANLTGSTNVAVGDSAMTLNKTGSNNVGVGNSALGNSGSATTTVAIGSFAGFGTVNYSNQGGTYVGTLAGRNLTSGSDYNTLFGYSAGIDITTGTDNLILGTQKSAGTSITTGSNNILLGTGVRAGVSQTGSNQLNIGNLIFASGIASESTLSTGSVGIATTTPGSLLSVGTTNGINFSTATSTFNSTGGINIAAGCFAVNGTCLGSGSGSGTVNAGLLGQLSYYAAAGTALSGASNIYVATDNSLRATNFFASTTNATTTNTTNLLATSATTTNLAVLNGMTAASSTVSGTTTTSGLYASFANLLSALFTSFTAYTGTVGTLTATSSASLASTTLSGATLLTRATTTYLSVTNGITAASTTISGALTATSANFGGGVTASSTGLTANTINVANINLTGSFTAALQNGYVFRGSATNTSQATSSLFISDLGFVGIGSTAPSTKLTVSNNTSAFTNPYSATSIASFQGANAAAARVDVFGFGSSANVGVARSNGTAAAPTALALNDAIGSFGWRGYGTSAWSATSRAIVQANAAENWTDAAQGAYLTFSTTPTGAVTLATERMRIDAAGNVGIGSTTPGSILSIGTGSIGINFTTATSTFNGTGGINLKSGCFSIGGTCLSTGGSSQWTTAGSDIYYNTGNVGIGSTTPGHKLSVTNTSAAPQTSIAYDGTRYTTLKTDSAGDFFIDPQGNDAYMTDDNLWVCAGGACPAGSPSSNGTLIVESRIGIGTGNPQVALQVEGQGWFTSPNSGSNGAVVIRDASGNPNTAYLQFMNNAAAAEYGWVRGLAAGGLQLGGGNVGVGTSTPAQQLSVSNNLFVGNGGVSGMGQATSTFQGDIKILGKLDVGTIDPPYTISGVKYATYGHATIGIHEETLEVIHLSLNQETGRYEYVIDFENLERGSDLWLFYQVTTFGLGWKELNVMLTPSFSGLVHYEKQPETGKLVIIGTQEGEVSMRLAAMRYDGLSWPNLRSDQDGDTRGTHVVEEK